MSLGVMTTDRLAIVAALMDFTGADVPDVPGRLANLSFHGRLRYWVVRRIWAEAGAGPTYSRVLTGEGDAQVESGEWGWGAISGAGYDLIQARNTSSGAHVTVPVQIRVATNSAGGVRANSWTVLSGIVVGW
jgi:hypothetical protein